MSYRCRVDGHDATAVIGDDGLSIDGRPAMSWLDADIVREANHGVTLVGPAGEVALTQLGGAYDRFCRELREARGAVRRAALTQATSAPLDSYESHDEGQIVDIHLCAGALVVEPRGGSTTCVPLPSILAVARDGWTITVTQRVFEPVVLRGLGPRTDELISDLDVARTPLFGDGWAASGAVPGGERAAEAELLAQLAGDRLRVGVWTDGGRVSMPFVLAPVGDLVAVEATDADDRATYIFRVDDVEWLNAVLVLTTFRREVYSLPDDQLG
ncbi:MAG TPA: hypothetical protein VK461_05975, partial [Acidimicrobiales bacterium]|nr:hypothetical protein [Acidimicrobiales bacterium]